MTRDLIAGLLLTSSQLASMFRLLRLIFNDDLPWVGKSEKTEDCFCQPGFNPVVVISLRSSCWGLGVFRGEWGFLMWSRRTNGNRVPPNDKHLRFKRALRSTQVLLQQPIGRSNTPAHSFTFSHLWTDKLRLWRSLGGCPCLFGCISEAGSTFNLYCSQFRLKEYIPGSLRAKINQQHLWHNVYYHQNKVRLYSETCNGSECSQSINIKILNILLYILFYCIF